MRERARRSYGEEDSGTPWSIWAGVALLACLVGAGVWLQSNQREVDKASGCPTDKLEHVTAVLIDLTDSINGVQQAALRNALLATRDSVPKFGLLEIYPLTQTPSDVLQPIYSGCSPGSGKEQDNSLYGNPALADMKWKTEFGDKIDAIASTLKNQPTGDHSPILEGLQSVAATAFGPAIRQHAPHKSLVVISDMIHYTAELNMYKGVPNAKSFIGSPYYARTRASLRGAEVNVFLVVRDVQKEIQQPPFYKFWVDLIEACDGYLKFWEPLQ